MKSTPKKLRDGRWKIRIYPFHGSKACKQKICNTKKEALEWANQTYDEIKGTNDDQRTLSDLINLWFKYYGSSLRSGLDRKNQLLRFAEQINDPIWTEFNKSHFVKWRDKQTMTANSINHWHTYVKSLFTQLKSLDLIDFQQNPLDDLKKLKVQETELSWLTTNQIYELLEFCDTELSLIVRLGVSCGLRWSEIISLKPNQLQNGVLLVQGQTKNSKNRQIGISTELENEVKSFLKKDGNFKNRYKAFRLAIKKANITLPRGQLTHVLRHTFASHFIQNGGDILTLQKILGHSDIKTTQRYSHLAPSFYNQATLLNPLSFKKI